MNKRLDEWELGSSHAGCLGRGDPCVMVPVRRGPFTGNTWYFC